MSRTRKSVNEEFLFVEVTGWSGGYWSNGTIQICWHHFQPHYMSIGLIS